MKRWPLGLILVLAFPLGSAGQSMDSPAIEAESENGSSGAKADSPSVERGKPADFSSAIGPLLAQHCTACHGGESPKADLSLAFDSERAVEERLRGDRKLFERVAERVRSGEMPPEDRPRLSEAEKALLLSWIDRDLLKLDASGAPHIGHVARVRRLTRVEYANTVRDLLYFTEFKADDLPPDDKGYGFDNIADLLTVSPNHLEQYMAAAEAAMKQLDATAKVSRNWAERDGTYFEPDDGVFLPIKNVKLGFNNNQDRVRIVLQTFLPRAYRRPVTDEEIDRLLVFARLSLTQEGESFIRPMSAYAAMRAALNSPYFLYRIEDDPAEGVAPINEYELASRLSYFLWSSMPDDELIALAKEGKLRERQDEQVRRMLKDAKSRALVENFAEQWLHLSALAKVSPDPKLYPEFDEPLREAMREETARFVQHVIAEDRSVMELLNADYTFLNARLAKHYGIEGVEGDEFQLVQLEPGQHRGGLLTQGSILTLTSPPTRTSPVKRGIWVLETLFNDPPSPPPADVPPLEDEGGRLTGTVRQVLQKHRDKAECAGCHNKIDPYGLALENYSAIGAWRDKEGNSDNTIDSSGVLPDGKSFRDVAEFRAAINGRQAEFREALVEKLLIYSLGRGLEYADRAAVQEICARSESGGDRFSCVILAIVESDLFQKRMAKGN